MALLTGTRLGPYEIHSALGAGGMGEVYKARDTRLDRTVAIKVLPETLASDPMFRERFDREAKAIAALQHPHICTLHDVGRQDGVDYLVLEYLDGQTLAERLTKGALPTDQALTCAIQIADALDKAHRAGIVHRDLKPGNVMLTKSGVKLLDFGLAKTGSAGLSATGGLSALPTEQGLTAHGTILGTFQYMAPEQLEGKDADARTDIFAFGAVVYEMVTGKKAFEGKSQASLISAIMSGEPAPITAVQPMSPPTLDRVVKKCLRKDREERWQSARDIADELKWIAEGGSQPGRPASVVNQPIRRERSWMTAFAVAVLGMIALTVPTMRHLRETPLSAPPEMRLEISTPATDRPADFALSPDGRQIVFVASGDGASRLWLRSLATTTVLPLTGTEGASYPFWAPDGRSVGFFAGNALKRLDVVSGGGSVPQTLAPVGGGRGGTWNADGVIVFAPVATAGLMRVSATGGATATVTTLSPPQFGHVAPSFLPDGRRFLFYVRDPDTAGIYLGALDGSAPTRLTAAEGAGVYLPEEPGPAEASREGGWLLWVREGTLVAQRLDIAQAVLTGEPVTLADGVAVDNPFRSAVSAAATGLVAYRSNVSSQRQLTWMDRSGTARGTVGEPDATLLYPSVSPDGLRVAVRRTVQGNQDLWLLDGARTGRFTFDAASESFPVWSPDGIRIVFRSDRRGHGDLYQKLTSGAGMEEALVASDQTKNSTSWSTDGRFLLYHSNDPQSNGDLLVVPMEGDRTPSVFLKTPFREAFGAFSPDGRWVAYQSNESGRPEIYVRPFIPLGSGSTSAASVQWLVSTAGGIVPVWRPDGKELYYLNPAGAMMAAPITVTGATLAPGTPVVLFPTRIVGGGADVQVGRNYDVAPDGRFLINTELDSADAPITLLMNWHPDARE